MNVKKEKETPSTPHVGATANYAPARVGTQRYSRTERAEMQKGVSYLFDAPRDAVLRSLIGALERIQGRTATPRQHAYLLRCFRIHGPGTEALLTRLYRERGNTENLLLALELAPPAYLEQRDDDTELGGMQRGSREHDPRSGRSSSPW